MNKYKTKNELLKINLLFTFFIILVNVLAFIFIDSGKDNFTKISAYANGLLFFGYLIILGEKAKKDVLELKKEALYVNYPLYIGAFIGFILIVLLFSAICLFTVNPEAANITFIFTFFMSTISMLTPSILLMVFMFFAVPAFIIPSFSNKKGKSSNLISKILFICFVIYCIFNVFNALHKIANIENQKKFKSAKVAVKYSTDFLKFKNVGSYTMKLLSRSDISVPLYHTAQTVPHKNSYEAEIFCNSMNARVPNFLETYHIVFNKFDTFGEKYYWTSDKDGRFPLVLHYKNMSYNIIRKPDNVTPVTYCVAKDDANYGFGAKHFFYRNVQQKTTKSAVNNKKTFDLDIFKDISEKELKQTQIFKQKEETSSIKEEKKYVNFSVKEVSPAIFKELQAAGYYYNPETIIKKEYETNDFTFTSRVRENTNNIKLCYFPFTDYGNLSIKEEQQIWQKSFCSPSFDISEQTPVLKSRYEKEAYCYTKGGRLPNIPELNGILKTLGRTQTNVKYWTNNKINGSDDVLVYYKDSRFMKAEKLTNNEIDSAYVFCVKKSDNPSQIISNYKSRFNGVSGQFYATQQCSNCYYYEVPDVILQE